MSGRSFKPVGRLPEFPTVICSTFVPTGKRLAQFWCATCGWQQPYHPPTISTEESDQ